MKLKNTTDIDNELIREIIRFSKPCGVTNFDISIKNTAGPFAGAAYPSGYRTTADADPLITIRIGPAKKFPYLTRANKGRGYLDTETFTRTEGLVHIIAHELRHLWQAKHPKGCRVWGARGQFSQRDADAYAIHKVREWRRAH